VVWGAAASCKSFLAASMAVAVASGRPWFGKTVKPGVVLYIVGEGGTEAFARRLRAAATAVGVNLDNLPLWLESPAVDLTSPAKLEAVWEPWDTIAPDFVIVDTLSRCLPGDENSQEVMQGFVGACDAIRTRYEAPVLVLHHANVKNQMRGSSVLRGAADVEIHVWRTQGMIHLKANKLKDLDTEGFEPSHITPKVVDCLERGDYVLDEFGDKVTTLVLPEENEAGGVPEMVSGVFFGLWDSRPEGTAVGYKEWFEASGLPATSFKRALTIILNEPRNYQIVKAARGQYIVRGEHVEHPGETYRMPLGEGE
jgi:hypothetical protein